MMAANPAAPSPLESLAAELRNRIYRYVLVSPKEVDVTETQPAQPPLLRVNRKIRTGTLSIFYEENDFSCNLFACEGAKAIPFTKVYKKYVKQDKFRFQFGIYDYPNWDNLLLWLKACHDKVLDFIRPTDVESPLGTVLVAAFSIVEGMEDCSWEEVEQVLEDFREVIAMVDDRWRTGTTW